MVTINQIGAVALALVVGVIVTSIGAQILGQIKATQTANTYEANVTGYGQSGLNALGQWFPTIGLIVAATIVIGIIVSAFAGKRQ
jgi:multisubunit Na+/H+ antiporter MnhB subunit